MRVISLALPAEHARLSASYARQSLPLRWRDDFVHYVTLAGILKLSDGSLRELHSSPQSPQVQTRRVVSMDLLT
jgi:hypothetical protein